MSDFEAAPRSRPSAGRVALALGSGGARGYAHIGVIQVLEESGYEVVEVAGSSIGALVGGVFAAGRLDEYTAWVTGLTQRDIFRLLDPALKSPGAIRAEKIIGYVRDLVADVHIEDLAIPFTAVATDLLDQEQVWFRDGPLDSAIRASIAMPSIITPLWRDGRLLADGGILNPLPVDAVQRTGVDLVVAVTLGGERASLQPDALEAARAKPPRAWQEKWRHTSEQIRNHDRIRPLADRLAERLDRGDDHDADDPPPEEPEAIPGWLRTSDVVNLSLDAMQSHVTRLILHDHPPDVLVSIPKDACRTLDFHRADALIEIGRAAAQAALD